MEIEASVFAPLRILMKNAVSFGVTFGFGFNSPPFITKKKPKQNTSRSCQVLFLIGEVIALTGLLE